MPIRITVSKQKCGEIMRGIGTDATKFDTTIRMHMQEHQVVWENIYLLLPRQKSELLKRSCCAAVLRPFLCRSRLA